MKDYILLLIFLVIFVIIYIYLDYDKFEAFTTHGKKIGIVSMMKNPNERDSRKNYLGFFSKKCLDFLITGYVKEKK